MEVLRKQSGSGITFSSADGTQKSMEEYVAEEEGKEHDVQAQAQHDEETGHPRRRIIYRSPIKKALDDVMDENGEVRKYTAGEKNEKFGKALFQRMALNNAQISPLIIARMLYGSPLKPREIADEIKQANPKSKIGVNSVAAAFTAFKNSDLRYLLDIEKGGVGPGRGAVYSFPREVRINCGAERLYRVYLKSYPDELKELADEYEEIRMWLKRKKFTDVLERKTGQGKPKPAKQKLLAKEKPGDYIALDDTEPEAQPTLGVTKELAEKISGRTQPAIPSNINVNINITFRWGGFAK